MTAPPRVTVRETVDGATIEATASSAVEPQLRTIVAVFADKRAEWRDGFMIWMGWGPLILTERDGTFVLASPDYRTDPNHVTEDLTTALLNLMWQVAITNETGVEPVDTAFNAEVICVRDWAESPQLLLRRSDPEGDDSGWFIQPFPLSDDGEYQPDQLVRTYAWQLVLQRDAIGRVLALPPGVAALIDGDHVQTIIRESDMAVLAENV